MSLTERVASGIRLIENAFPTEPLPPPIPPGPQNIEVKECYEDFSGPWTQLGNKVRRPSCLTFLEVEARVYYLPAFLRAMLASIGSSTDDTLAVVLGSVLMHTCPENASYITPYLTRKQGKAIHETLFIVDACFQSLGADGLDEEDLEFWRSWSSQP